MAFCTVKPVQRIVWATQMLIGVVILMTTDQHQVMFSNLEELRSVGKVKRKTSVALSTAEAEYMALSSATQEASWMRQLLVDLNCGSTTPTVIYEDNQSSICIAKNPLFHGRTKHIGIKYHFVREQVKNKNVEIVYCPTEDMIADRLTKGRSQDKFEKLREMIGIKEMEKNNLPASEKEC